MACDWPRGESSMCTLPKRDIIFGLCFLLSVFSSFGAKAQTIYFGVQNVALKSGESAELAQVYYIGANCKSLLKARPEVEIMDGPPGVTAAIREEMVVPRGLGCAQAVQGGKLVITANEIEDYGRARLVLRIKLKTSVGDRQYSRDVLLSLIPVTAGPRSANEVLRNAALETLFNWSTIRCHDIVSVLRTR